MQGLEKGVKVWYKPTRECGIVKRVDRSTVYVVFNCGGDWGNYDRYTAAMCSASDLEIGWP